MPSIRHRMRSRRGSSRGRAIRPQSSSETDTPPEDVVCGHTPETRSKRGRAGPVHSTHGSPPLHFASSQSIPHFAAPPVAFRHTSQRAEFQFVCSMDRPILTAYITVSLQEEAACSKPSDTLAPQPPLAHDRTVSENAAQELTREGKAKDQGVPATATCATTDEHDSSYAEYCCRIVEEPTLPVDDK